MAAKLNILGVYREREKGQNAVGDRAIAKAVAAALQARGHNVKMLEGFEAYNGEDAVFSLSRSDATLSALGEIESKGIPVINPPQGIRKCIDRVALFRALGSCNARIPKTEFFELEGFTKKVKERFYLKRDEHFGMVGDSVPIYSQKELENHLEAFRERGTQHLLVQDFVEGPCIKFYGVGRKIFTVEPPQGKIPDSGAREIKKIVLCSSRCIGVSVFGGDIILSPKGPFLVDFNEWPSFSAVRALAASEIARLLTESCK